MNLFLTSVFYGFVKRKAVGISPGFASFLVFRLKVGGSCQVGSGRGFLLLPFLQAFCLFPALLHLSRIICGASHRMFDLVFSVPASWSAQSQPENFAGKPLLIYIIFIYLFSVVKASLEVKLNRIWPQLMSPFVPH